MNLESRQAFTPVLQVFAGLFGNSAKQMSTTCVRVQQIWVLVAVVAR